MANLYEQQKVRKTVEQVTAELDLIQRISRIGTWFYDPEEGTPRWSEEIYRIYDRDPALGPLSPGDYPQIYSPGYYDVFHSAFTAAVEKGTPYEIELRLDLPSGKTKWISAICEPLPEKGPAGHCLRGTIQDNTERKKTEENLHRSRELMARAESIASVGAWEWNLCTDCWSFSDVWQRIHGFSKNTLSTRELLHLAHPDDRPRIEDALRAVIDQGKHYNLEHRIVRKTDGETRWVHAQGELIRDDENQPVLLCGAAQDITDNKRHEETLRHSEQRLQAVFNAVDGVPIQGYDTDRRVAFWNAASEKMYGYSCEEAMGQLLEDLIIPEEARDSVVAGIQRWLDEDIPIPACEIELLHKSGERLQVYSNHFMITNSQGDREMFCIDVDLTRVRQIERRMASFSAVVEHSNNIIVVKDLDLRVVATNQAFANAAGHASVETMIGRTDAEIFGVLPDTEPIRSYMEDERRAQKLAPGEYILREEPVMYPDGEERIFLTKKYPIYDQRNTLIGTGNISTDITERKKAEENLRNLEKRYRSLIDHSPACHKIIDPDMNLQYMSANGFRMLKLEENSDAYGKPYPFDFFPQHARDTMIEALSTVKTSGTMMDFESEACDAEGNTVWLHHTLIPVFSDQGTLNHITVVSADCTHQKQAERKLVQQTRSLELHNRIANVFLTSPREEIYADVLDVLLEILDSRFGLFGYINEEGDMVSPSMTRDIWEKCQVPEKSIVFPKASWGGLWGRVLLEKKTFVANENLHVPKGHIALENAMATPILHQENLIGQIVVGNREGGYDRESQLLLENAASILSPMLFAILEDVRQKQEKKLLEEQLQQALKMDAVGRLAGGVAHDFNNMLGVILGHTDMLLMEYQQDHELHEHLVQIKKASERSADLTRQLLAFARKQTVVPKVIDLNETLADMLRMLQRLIGEEIELSWIPGKEVWPVLIDPSQIDQALVNMCVNARDSIPGVGKITIETANVVFDRAYCEAHSDCEPGDYVQLAISDTGCGMDKETLAKVFEPFFTTKEVGKGTGLGLAMVYGVIKQNDGFINVYSEPGQGTTFRVYLPRHITNKTPAPDKTADTSNLTGHETILLVEDEPSILKMTSMMLKQQGYSVIEASTPGTAIQLAQKHSAEIQLLMTDVIMPEMNGHDLSQKILSFHPGVKCLFMSGYTASVIDQKGILEEVIHFIQKPFSMDSLSQKLREALDGR